jgi:LysR family hydrogen peroxide-inducible transcriptional activator
MTLTQYSYIVAIDNYKSFAEAAQNCYVTQPTLSMQVKKMEENLGILIFDRSKQPVEATDVGRKIIKQARVILREHERISDLIDEEKGELKGKFRVGIIPTIAPYLIPLFLVNFMNKYPKVELIFDEIQTDQIIQKLLKDDLDTAIIASTASKNELIEKKLYFEPFVGYISKDHEFYKLPKVSANQLNVKDLWLLKEGHCFRDHAIQVCKSNDTNKYNNNMGLRFEGGTLDTLIKLVDNNIGMTLLPYLAINELKNSIKRKQIREFTTPVPKRVVNLVHHRAHLKKQLIDAFETEIVSVLPKELLSSGEGLIVT